MRPQLAMEVIVQRTQVARCASHCPWDFAPDVNEGCIELAESFEVKHLLGLFFEGSSLFFPVLAIDVSSCWCLNEAKSCTLQTASRRSAAPIVSFNDSHRFLMSSSIIAFALSTPLGHGQRRLSSTKKRDSLVQVSELLFDQVKTPVWQTRVCAYIAKGFDEAVFAGTVPADLGFLET